MTTYPAGVTTLLNQVRSAVSHIKGLHVEAYARGVLITTRDTEGAASRLSKAHAALHLAGVAPSHIIRQAPTVLKVTAPRTNRTRKARKNV
jgi:hypothetical protein